MEIIVSAAELGAHGLDVGGRLSIEELQIAARDVALSSDAGGPVRAARVDATLTITEAALNRFLAGAGIDAVRDLQVSLLSGRVRLRGRYQPSFGPAVPFTLNAVPEIEGGARLRLEATEFTAAYLPLGAMGARVVGDRINESLARAFDATRLPVPLRLTTLSVETGRFVLSATAAVELRPAEMRIAPRSGEPDG